MLCLSKLYHWNNILIYFSMRISYKYIDTKKPERKNEF